MDYLFNVEKFRSKLSTSWLGSEVLYKEQMLSTSTFLKGLPAEELSHGELAITDTQISGRGQYDRGWETEPYSNLTFTLALKPKSGERLNLLTLGCAYALKKAIDSLVDDSVTIKWPNDLYIGDRKVAGFLTECMFLGSAPERVLIGIGLNVNQTVFNGKLERTATSLALATGRHLNREKLLCAILSEMEYLYTRWHKQDPDLHLDISKSIIGYGEWVNIRLNGQVLKEPYKFLGVNKKGECLLLNEGLDVNTFSHEQIRIITGLKSVSESA